MKISEIEDYKYTATVYKNPNGKCEPKFEKYCNNVIEVCDVILSLGVHFLIDRFDMEHYWVYLTCGQSKYIYIINTRKWKRVGYKNIWYYSQGFRHFLETFIIKERK